MQHAFRCRLLLVSALLLTVWLSTEAGRLRGSELEELVKQAEQFPTKGKPPELFQIHGIMADLKPATYIQPQAELLWKLARKLGVREDGYERKPNETMPRPKWQDAAYLNEQQLLFPVLRQGTLDDVGKTKSFQEFLAKKVSQPGEVGLNKWEDAKLQPNDKSSLLYYYSRLFLTEYEFARPLRLRGPWSPDPDYWPKEATWVRPFRCGALSEPWSEEISYRVPEVSPQSSGYLLAALRCGARERNLPITWNLYCDTPGTTPENLRRAYYTAIAHGAKRINFRGAVPQEFAQGKHFIGGPDAVKMWRTVHDLIHETGQFEKVVHPATMRRGDIGLLLSFAQDLWEPDTDRNHERKCIYLAYRMGGYNVEFITEEDIQAGKHKHLKAIITTGNYLERATARELLKFIRGGGRFSCFGYAGFKDEHNRPLDILAPALGVTTVKEQRQGSLGLSKKDLPGLQPIDTVEWESENVKHKMPVLVLRNSFEVRKGATVSGKYADGSPAAVRFQHGSGATWLIGTYLASGFIREGLLPARPWRPGAGQDDINNFLPTHFNSEIGDIITSVCEKDGYDVYFDQKLVEPVLMEGPNGIALILINWNPTPQNVLITIDTLPAGITKAVSVSQGELQSQRGGNSLRFRVRLDVTDVILFEK
jgi:hypothetical protein